MTAQQHQRHNFRFLASLDSARTAHVFEGEQSKDTWWFPRSRQTWEEHTSSAEATVLKQVLWGDTVVLPRNQFFDSPPWFNLAEYLLRAKTPTFAISIYPDDLDLVPASFPVDVARGFGSSKFALSGWPGMTETENVKISKNIERTGDFRDMFDDVSLESAYKDIFEYQRDILQQILEYLTDHYLDPAYSGLISRAEGASTSLWEKLKRDVENKSLSKFLIAEFGDDVKVAYLSFFHEIERKALAEFQNLEAASKLDRANRWLSARTNLYRELWSEDEILRELLRLHIDVRYSETLAESCTGRARHARVDRSDTDTTHEMRDSLSDVLDAFNDPGGLLEDTDILFDEPRETRKFLAEVVDILDDPDIEKQIASIRRVRIDPAIPSEYRKEREIDHLEILASGIPELTVERSGQAVVVRWLYNNAWTLTIVIGILLFPDPSAKGTVAGIELARKIVKGFLTEKAEDALKKRVGEPAEEMVFDALFADRKRALTGKVRDWLDAPGGD